MKKLCMVLVCCLVVLFLVGCGKDQIVGTAMDLMVTHDGIYVLAESYAGTGYLVKLNFNLNYDRLAQMELSGTPRLINNPHKTPHYYSGGDIKDAFRGVVKMESLHQLKDLAMSSANIYTWIREDDHQVYQGWGTSSGGWHSWKWNTVTYGSARGQLLRPDCLAIDPSDNIYIADRWNKRITKFDQKGNWLAEYPLPGDPDGYPIVTDIAWYWGYLYIITSNCTSSIERIRLSTGEWECIKIQDTSDMIAGRLEPLAMDIDDDGNLFLINEIDSSVVKICPTHEEAWFDISARWAGLVEVEGVEKHRPESECPVKFWRPRSIAVGGNHLWVANEWNVMSGADEPSLIQKYDLNGHFMESFGEKWIASKARIVRSSGEYLYQMSSDETIAMYYHWGAVREEWGSKGAGLGRFESPKDMAIDNRGHTYVLDFGSRIQEFNEDGDYVNSWRPNLPSGNTTIRGIAAQNDDLWVCGRYSPKYKDDYGFFAELTNSKLIRVIKLEKDCTAERVQLDGRGNIYILTGKPPFIRKYTGGKLVEWWGYKGGGDGRFQDPVDLALDAEGNVYVADLGAEDGDGRRNPGKIQKFNSEGKLLWRLDGIPE